MTDTLVVTFPVRPPERAVIADAIGSAARVVYLADLDKADRAAALNDGVRDPGPRYRPGIASR